MVKPELKSTALAEYIPEIPWGAVVHFAPAATESVLEGRFVLLPRFRGVAVRTVVRAVESVRGDAVRLRGEGEPVSVAALSGVILELEHEGRRWDPYRPEPPAAQAEPTPRRKGNYLSRLMARLGGAA